MRTIAIINQKGGCGKTTTAINLAGVFARNNLRTLLVDLDPQSHCAAGLAIPEQRIDIQIGDAMLAGEDKAIDWTRLLWRVSRNLDLAPSTVRLAGLEAARGGLSTLDNAERRLDLVLTRLADQYDACLIDCPPSIGMLTFNALVAASEVLIPVETGFFALQGAAKQINTIKALAKKLDVAPPFRLLPTIHDGQSTLARDVLDELNKRFTDRVIPVVIRLDARLREAVSYGQPIVEYAPESSGAEDYAALGRWLLDNPADRTGAAKRAWTEPKAADSPVEVRPTAEANVLGGRSRIDPASIRDALLAEVGAVAPASPPTDAGKSTDLSRAQRLAHLPTSKGTLTLVADAPKASPAPIVPLEALQPILGVRSTKQGTLFAQPTSLGRTVCIAGDFNNWSGDGTPMRRNEAMGILECLVPLPPGRHQYRLVVDGRWLTDPYNLETEINQFGSTNSVVLVPSN